MLGGLWKCPQDARGGLRKGGKGPGEGGEAPEALRIRSQLFQYSRTRPSESQTGSCPPPRGLPPAHA